MPQLKIRVWYPREGLQVLVGADQGEKLCIPCFGWVDPPEANVSVRLMDHGEGSQAAHAFVCKPVTDPPFKDAPRHFRWFTDLWGLESGTPYVLVATAAPTPELVQLGYTEVASTKCCFMAVRQTKRHGKVGQLKRVPTVSICYPASNSTVRPSFSAYGTVEPTNAVMSSNPGMTDTQANNYSGGLVTPPPFPYNWCFSFNNIPVSSGPPNPNLYTLKVTGTDSGDSGDGTSTSLNVQTSG